MVVPYHCVRRNHITRNVLGGRAIVMFICVLMSSCFWPADLGPIFRLTGDLNQPHSTYHRAEE